MNQAYYAKTNYFLEGLVQLKGASLYNYVYGIC
jgi:hypothetical protein